MSTLQGKVVVITGASSGFGKGAALKFAEEGATVVLAARRGELLEELARECERYGGRALAVPADVSRREEVERLAETAVKSCGRIDVWVNDAGVGALGPFDRIPIEVHEQVIRTDLLGTLYGSYCAYRRFVGQGSGVLINIASELGREAAPYYSSYCAAKHGVVGLTAALRAEIVEKKLKDIHALAVLPGAHDTPFFDHAANYTGQALAAPESLFDPQNVVETIVRLAADPRDRRIVGRDGEVTIPNLSLADKAPAQPPSKRPGSSNDSPGAVRAPVPQGTGVSAGRRQ
ncbi:MAG TPA: SDR family NAD(P)-dependent oxidoreductase [Burkholderiales bacterium]